MPSTFLGRAEWRLGLGTYRLGAKTEFAVRTALRLGYRHIDTAALYGNEAAVASAVAASGVRRREICIATKIHRDDIARLSIRRATEAALSQLREIDLMMLHTWHPNAPEAWALLAEEAAAGRVRAIGVSNFGAADLAALSPPRPTVNQIELSPFLPRDTLRQACRNAGVTVSAHSPLAKAQRFSDLSPIAGADTAAAIMLAWGLEKADAVLPRSCEEHHLRENLDAQNVELSAAQREALRSLSEGYATHPHALRE